MRRRSFVSLLGLPAAACALMCLPVQAAPPAFAPPQSAAAAAADVAPAATHTAAAAESASAAGSAQLKPGDPSEHPLMPALRWARGGVSGIEKLEDYSATLVKRERLGDKLGDQEFMFLKVRHRPFSVYMYFLAPAAARGREVMWIAGANNDKMWAHDVGLRASFGTVSLKPDGMIAMAGQRYPITEIGLLNLTRRLIEVAEQDMKYAECEVKYYKDAKINNRSCTLVEVIHPKPRKNFLFHMARIFVDDEHNVPIRYESYDWPQEGGKPELMEEYTYLNLKFNNGFADADFDIRNPSYKFK